jgi:hypothetical protein
MTVLADVKEVNNGIDSEAVHKMAILFLFKYFLNFSPLQIVKTADSLILLACVET